MWKVGMMSEVSLALTPREKIVRAICDLQKDQPFFAHLAMNMKIKEMPEGHPNPTMGVDAKGNMFYADEFVSQLTKEQVIGVVCHEVLHRAVDHISRIGGRNPRLANVAQDVAVNMMVKQSGLQIPEVWKIKDNGKMVEARGIPADVNRDSSVFELYVPEKVNINIQQVSQKPWESIYSEIIEQIKRQKGDPQGAGDGKGRPGKGNGGFDEHMHGKDGETGEDLSSEELAAEADKWRSNLANAATFAKQQGKLPAGMQRILAEVLKPKVRWKELLLRYIKNHGAPVDWSYHKPGKRSHALGIFLPTVVRESVDVEILVDVSGSISDKELQMFLSEIVAIARSLQHIEMAVTFVDAAVHERYHVRNGDIPKILAMKASGGGGTRLEAGLEMIKEQNPSIPLAIVLTDGCDTYSHRRGDFAFDVLWVITPNGVSLDTWDGPKYGSRIKMDE
jgi:predicted metal-dependent peptidase